MPTPGHNAKSIVGLSIAMAAIGIFMVGGSVVGVGMVHSNVQANEATSISADGTQKWEGTLDWAAQPEAAPAIEHGTDLNNPFSTTSTLSPVGVASGLNVTSGIEGIPELPDTLNKSFGLFLKTESSFKGGNIVYPNTNMAMARAVAAIGNAAAVCSDGECYNLCDHVAGDIWGYEVASGYPTARIHWETMVSRGLAKQGDKTPPLGALLFWDSGEFGHVATYIGNGRVVTNLVMNGKRNLFVVDADWYERNGRKYLGWADPIFFGQNPGKAL
jgi:hypothetical protein